MSDYTHVRREYNGIALSAVPADPFELLQAWLVAAKGQPDATAMVVATVDADGFPDTRVVLLKEVVEEELIFYTNVNSVKGQQLNANAKVAANFYWPGLSRQVRLRGEARRVAAEKAAAYFAVRPRGSQIAALASRQSMPIPSREGLIEEMAELEQKLDTVTCPIDWGGYAITPCQFEFWQGRDQRVHDRFCYRLVAGVWQVVRLAP